MSVTFRLLVDSWSGFSDTSNNGSYVTLVRHDEALSPFPSVIVSKGKTHLEHLKSCCIRGSNILLSVSEGMFCQSSEQNSILLKLSS